MKINWKVRLNNKVFWLTAIPALLLLIQAVLTLFGITWDYSELAEKLSGIVTAAFVVLALLGVVNDPTVSGVSDSDLAMTYETPKNDQEQSR